ncbi:Aste57867_1058 [Aphanomyces stellatus]|uniref:Aste57867_1058 protein n=1 Tax=Aphanomyces stellatus TaxID=120398 RepID=A0A485K5G9_9STRA|nr:hypothetical protein As57867_001057 [Aphanomyces stellatus]VFT78280.1 Aste57867_1058 [Aphanomyces stellatus]
MFGKSPAHAHPHSPAEMPTGSIELPRAASTHQSYLQESTKASPTKSTPLLEPAAAIVSDDGLAAQVTQLVHLRDQRRQYTENSTDSLGLGNLNLLNSSARVDDRVYWKHVAGVTSGLRRIRVDGTLLQSAWTCVEELLGHRQVETRSLAFDFVDVCLEFHYERVPPAMRLDIFHTLARGMGHSDFVRRQKSMRLLLQDGRSVKPFAAHLGWFLLTFLETSDAPKELSSLLHCILRRSPHALDTSTITAIATLLSARCDAAYTRGEKDTCKRFLKFMTILVTHNLDAAASIPACLRTMCGLVNVKEDGVSTWTIMKHLLSGASGYRVLRGLLELLDEPVAPYVLRGAVFFVGMSSWGSQRIASLEIGWGSILLSLLPAVQSRYGVVIFELVLSLQRLIKKYGEQMHIEWDLVFEFFQRLVPWMQTGGGGMSSSSYGDMDVVLDTYVPDRLPSELLDTLLLVDELHKVNRFQGDVHDFFGVVELYMPFCPLDTVGRLLAFRAEACHPGTDSHWLAALHDLMTTFYASPDVHVTIRLQALEILQGTVEACRYICDDRILDEVLLPCLQYVYDDDDVQVRKEGLEVLLQMGPHMDMGKFQALVDVLHHAVTVAKFPDAQHAAIHGLTTLFSTCFTHMPSARCVRLFELLTGYCVTHRDAHVRFVATTCLLHVCTANAAYQMQWDDDVSSMPCRRTSPFLVAARPHVKPSVAALPIAKLVVTVLTMASTETNATTFDLAVDVLFKMIGNRFVLHDVDMNDITLKVVSCVECRAFGRAAASHTQHKPKRARAQTDSGGGAVAADDAMEESRHKAVLTQYLHRGFELLLLLASQEDKLSATVRSRVLLTFVGGLDMQPTPVASIVSAPKASGLKRTGSERTMTTSPPSSSSRSTYSPDAGALQSAESTLVHTLTRGLTVLALLRPDTLLDVLPTILHTTTHRLCKPPPDGAEWPIEITSLGLQLLWNVLGIVPSPPDAIFPDVVEFSLAALLHPSTKYMASLATLVLMQCFTLSPSRVQLADIALPRLHAMPIKPLIVETAIDFIQTRIHGSSATTPSHRLPRHATVGATASPLSMSWVHRNTILTVSGPAEISPTAAADDTATVDVTVRRATTSYTWTLPNPHRMHPMHVMTLLYAIDPLDSATTTTTTTRAPMQRLVDGEALHRALNVLDRSPDVETHKVGVLYVPRAAATEKELLDVVGGSPRYVRFLRGLGDLVALRHMAGYNGGLDVSANESDGKYGLMYKDATMHVMFHVATMMHAPLAADASPPPLSSSTDEADDMRRTSKKRHIGNDFVHIVYLDYDANGDAAAESSVPTLSGQFNDVHIVVQPLDDDGLLYRTHVRCKAPLPPFGPLHGVQLVPSNMLAAAARLTAIHANMACRVMHQDRFEFVLNAEERLKQIKQIGHRLSL